jgi:hypothetical protein
MPASSAYSEIRQHHPSMNGAQDSPRSGHGEDALKGVDVGITLRVPDISLPPLARQGVHKDLCSPRWTNMSVAAMER